MNILACRHVFGADVPILVSDDISLHSAEIRSLAERMEVCHTAGGPRGHFGGDCQTCVDALAFAEHCGADLALKLSMRLILAEPVCAEIIERYFSDPSVWLGLPGKLSIQTIKRPESRFFAHFNVLTDMLVIRTGTISPQALKERYEFRVRNPRTYVDKLIESLWGDLMDVEFAGHTVRMPEFTNPYPGRDPLYLRKAQSEPCQYEQLAMKMGMKAFNPILVEWSRLSSSYRPAPEFI